MAQKTAGTSVKVVAYWDERSDRDILPWRALSPTICRAPQIGGVHFGKAVLSELERQRPDLTHLHGLWLRSSAHNHRWATQNQRPYVISPRGTLDPWALQNSSWKKRIARLWFENAHLRDCSCLHALCEEEAWAIRKFGLHRNPIAVIPNGISLPPELPSAPLSPPWASVESFEGRQILLFIGRIHPKKGLPMLLDAFSSVRSSAAHLAEKWAIVIAGYDQGGHLGQLQERARQLNIDKSIHFVGPVNGAVKDAALRQAAAFVLPSYSEGLPMSVLEAWAYRLPVVMTAQCNLTVGFSSKAALRTEPAADSLAETLLRLFEMSPNERRTMGANGRELAATAFSWDKIARDTVEMYEWLLGNKATPACIIDHKR